MPSKTVWRITRYDGESYLVLSQHMALVDFAVYVKNNLADHHVGSPIKTIERVGNVRVDASDWSQKQ